MNWLTMASPFFWTVVTLGVSWMLGYACGAILVSRLTRLAPARQRRLIESIVRLIRRGLPWWALMIGAWVAAGYWPITPEAHVLVERLLFLLASLSLTLTIATIASEAVDTYGALIAPALPVSSLTRNIVWILVATLGLLVVLNGLGLSITPMLTALGVGGLAVALALQEPLANFFAGLFITLAGQVRVGDYLKLESGQEGYVVDFSWRSTRLRMLANNLVIVPNAKLAQAIVINHHLPAQDLAVLIEVGVDYASDLARVETLVVEVGRAVMHEIAGGVPEFEPFIRYHTFGDSSIDFTVILRGREFVDQYLIKHEFIKRLHARFDREGVIIPFPNRTIIVRSASDTAAVPSVGGPCITASARHQRAAHPAAFGSRFPGSRWGSGGQSVFDRQT